MDTKTKLTEIDRRAKRYAQARQRLSSRYASFQRQIAKLQEKHLAKIKDALDTAADYKSYLEQAIAGAPELFTDPRTLTLHGVRVGFMEGKASVKLPKAKIKAAAVVSAIKAFYTPEQIRELGLIVTSEAASADALVSQYQQHSGLSLPGVDYTPAGDRVFIKPADHALDKMIQKLLEEGLQKGTAAQSEEDAA